MSPPLAGLPGHPPALWRKPGGGGPVPWSPEAMLPYAIHWMDETTSLSESTWSCRATYSRGDLGAPLEGGTFGVSSLNGLRSTVMNDAYSGSGCAIAYTEYGDTPNYLTGELDIWMVGRMNIVGYREPVFRLDGVPSGAGVRVNSYETNYFRLEADGTPHNVAVGISYQNRWTLYRMGVREGQMFVDVDGVRLDDKVLTLGGFFNFRCCVAQHGSSAQWDIAEVLMCRPVPESWAQAFTSYLMTKWGLV